MLRTRKKNSEVFYAVDRIIELNAASVQWLKKQAADNIRERARLCTHSNEEDLLHEMLIVHTHGTYIRPHKHIDKSESFHIVEGSVDVILFDDNGEVMRIIKMGNYESKLAFYYRIIDPVYHTLLIRSEVLVFHETTTGPFRPENTVFAPWSPDVDDKNACKSFLSTLQKICI
jgi:cupin fold WbuC family metalloprotein